MKTISLTVTLILLMICGISHHAAGAEKVILQLRWDHSFQFAGYYAALWKGYYAQAGLDAEMRPGINPEGRQVSATEAVAEGRAHFGIGAADILLARDKGADLRMLAPVFQQSPVEFYAKPETRLSSPADFAGLRVQRRVNDMTDIEMQALLLSEGVDISRIHFEENLTGRSLLTDTVDVVGGFSMGYYAYQTGKMNGRMNILRPASYGVDFYGDSLFARGDFIEKKPETVNAFLRASLKGWEYAMEHADEIAEEISNRLRPNLPLTDWRDYLLFQKEKVRQLTFHPVIRIGHCNEGRWRRMHSFLHQLGLVKKEFDSEFISDYKALEHRLAEKTGVFSKFFFGRSCPLWGFFCFSF